MGDFCDVTLIHKEAVLQAEQALPDHNELVSLADFYKLLADPTRLKILFALTKTEMCVCDLSALLEMSSSAVSHALKLLKQGRMVASRRDGKVIYYRLIDEHVYNLLTIGSTHLHEAV